MSIIFQPTEPIKVVCNTIDEGIGAFLKAIDNQKFGVYEFDVECRINIFQCIRLLESVIELAKKDLVFIQSAFILSRSFFEASLKVTWMLYPKDLFECEARYVTHLDTELVYLNKLIQEYKNLNWSFKELQDRRDAIMAFRDNLATLLSQKGLEIPKLPNVKDMLAALGRQNQYQLYMYLCQYTHLSHFAGNIYRTNLGIQKNIKENIRLEDWRSMLWLCWICFETITEQYVLKTQNQVELFNESFKQNLRIAIKQI